jgi:serine/threonine protein kinase
VFSQLVVAVALFHTERLVHHDLKPGNIFIDEDLNAIVGVCYFLFFFFYFLFFLQVISERHAVLHWITLGLSQLWDQCCIWHQKSSKIRSIFLFFFFMYYFVINNRHSFPCDIWSLGIILYKV